MPPSNPEELARDAYHVSAVAVEKLKYTKLFPPSIDDEDMIQQGVLCYLQVAKDWKTPKPDGPPWDKWKWIMIYHDLFDYYRKIIKYAGSEVPFCDMDIVDESTEEIDIIDLEDEKEYIRKLVSPLSPSSRRYFVSVYIDGISWPQNAKGYKSKQRALDELQEHLISC